MGIEFEQAIETGTIERIPLASINESYRSKGRRVSSIWLDYAVIDVAADTDSYKIKKTHPRAIFKYGKWYDYSKPLGLMVKTVPLTEDEKPVTN